MLNQKPTNSIHEAPLFGLQPVMRSMYMPRESSGSQVVSNGSVVSNGASGPITRTKEPIVTGTSVLGIKFKDGVMLAADTLGSYGSLARFRDERRLFQAGEFTAIGASGDLSDLATVKEQLDRLLVDNYCIPDGHQYSPENLYEYLARIMYSARNKFDPLWNTYMVAGSRDGRHFLGCVDLQGTTWQASTCATGYGAHIAQPLLRKAVEGKEHLLTEKEAQDILEHAMRVMYYRDARSLNRIQRATITKDGVKITEPYALETDWSIADYVKGYGILLLFFTSVCCSESSDSDVIAPLKVKSGMIINAVAFDHIHKRRYAAGYFAKTLDHTGKYGYEHGFISQVDYEGTVNWTHRITSVHDHRITDLVIDESNGDIFAVGTTYIDETDLEKNHLGGRTDSFLARLSSSGERLYLYKYGSAGDDYALKVSYFKSENNLFIAGTTNGTGTITVLQPGASSVATKPLAIEYPDFQMISQVAIAGKLSFLYIGTKFTENGTRAVVGHESMQGVIKWQTEIPGKGSYYGKGIDVLFSSHTVIVTGYKESEQLDDHENGYAFVAALRLSDGRILWIKTFGDNQGDVANSVAVSQRLSYIFNVGSEYQAASNLTVGYLRIFDHTGQALRTSYFDYTKQFEANISSFGLDVDVSDGDAKYAVAGYGQSGVDDYYSFLSFSQLKLIELPRTNPPKPIQRTSLVKTVYSGQSNRAQELTIVATVSTLSALVWVVLIICLYRIHSAKRDRLVQQQESLIQTRIKSRNRFRHRFGYTPYAIPMHNLAPPGIIMPVGSHNQQEPLPIQKSSHIRLE